MFDKTFITKTDTYNTRNGNIPPYSAQTMVSRSRVELPPAQNLSKEEIIDKFVEKISKDYSIEPDLVKSIIYYESRYKVDASNNGCVGLMQINTRWHKERARKLGVENFYDPYSNVLVGVDYLSELFIKYKEPSLVLMVYNMGDSKALECYKKGYITDFARLVLSREQWLKRGCSDA